MYEYVRARMYVCERRKELSRGAVYNLAYPKRSESYPVLKYSDRTNHVIKQPRWNEVGDSNT
jgi:hypothetical protein